ncbi:MAG: fumarylacetoacetate hydrolase family protein, partial [Desulfobacterales bacterium]
MKLVRYGPKGKEKPGLWQDGTIVDLRKRFPQVPDINETFFKEGWLERVAHIEEPGQVTQERIASPIHCPSKIICLGINYVEHSNEGGFEKPETPLIFCKASNALNGPYDPILLPKSSGQVDWEVELAIVIGKQGKRITKKSAPDYIAGFMVFNDVSGREAQFSDSQWFRGKSFDTFAPVGPFLVTLDEIGD